MRECKTCKKKLPPESFYLQDGLRRIVCRKCQNKKSLLQRDRVQKALYQAKRIIDGKRMWAKYKSTPQIVSYRKKYNLENAHKKKAHGILWRAVSSGLIKKPSCCSNCSATGRIEASHDDYTKPLQVEWLCVKCHRRKDNGIWVSMKKTS